MTLTLAPKRPGRFVSCAVPLEKGALAWDASLNPFKAFVGAEEVPCQTERIMRYGDNSTASVMVYVDLDGLVGSSVRLEFDPHREKTERDFKFHPKVSELRQFLPFKADASPTMNGAVCVQRRISDGEYEGVATFFHDCPAVRLDLIWHNARPGACEWSRRFLKTITVPSGWTVHYPLEEPLGGADGVLGDGQDHFVPQRAAREITAILHPIGYTGWREVAIDSGLAFVDWTDVAAWAPHFTNLADFSHISGLSQQQTNSAAQCAAAMKAGTQYLPAPWNYPDSRRYGFFHPGYDRVAGATSGLGITYGGPALANNPDLIVHALYESRFRRDRDWSAIILPSGEPATYEDYKVEIDSGKIRFSSDNPGTFDKTGGKVMDGSFGWSTQIPCPPSPERTALLGYATTDWAHRCRVNQWDSILLQLANHWPSRYRLRMEGELARMTAHSGKRINGLAGYATQGLGLPVDRIWGWMCWSMATAYALGSNALRTRYASDAATVVGMHAPATKRNRTLVALTSGKQCGKAGGTTPQDLTYGGAYGVCVGIQEGLTGQGWYALASVTGASAATEIAHVGAEAVEFLRDGKQTVWSAATFALAEKQPYQARHSELDSHLWATGAYDSEQTRGLVALYGFELLKRGMSTASVEQMLVSLLGPAPTAALRKMGTQACDSDSIVLAFSQKVGLP